jgi:hypothetical protein
MPNLIIIHEGTIRPEQEKTYLHLPFDMPADATRLEVEYTYSDKIESDPLLTGGNTIDLGVFDTRGIDFLAAGFRGWSGSERLSFFITETEATPGYLPGPLIAGRWHVLLGLYKIAPEGCVYRVKVMITVNTTADRRPPTANHHLWSAFGGQRSASSDLPSSMPRAPFAPWLRGELHCHTWHSDGDRSPADVVRLARERGLDFLAISDHNTPASQRELANLRDPGLVLIRGVEATTFKGHFNIWGILDWVDFRVQRPEDMEAALRFANERGAVTACGHPKPFGPPWEFESVTNYHCIEVWNGPWTLLNQMSLDFWIKQLATGRRIPAIGGSDWHRQRELESNPPRAPGIPTVWVYVPGTPSASAILDAIRRGHIVLTDRPNGAFLDLHAGEDFAAMGSDAIVRPSDGKLSIRFHCQRSADSVLRLLDQQGVLFEQTIVDDDVTVTIELSVSNSLYVRAELRTRDDVMEALTNPVYLEG